MIMFRRPPSLNDFLLAQFKKFNVPDDIRRFGEYLIQNLDYNGRLQSSLAEIVQVYGEQFSMEDAQQTLELIQRLDPAGVGARDYKECLLLQLTDETPYRDVLTTLITSHLEDLAQNRLSLILRKTGYSIELIKPALKELKCLNPFPGSDFEQQLT